jgi:L,D-transpeptidase YcbB
LVLILGRAIVLLRLFLFISVFLALPVQAATVQELLAASPVKVEGVTLDAPALQALYSPRNFERLWTDKARALALLEVLEGAAAHGLDPDDYYTTQIKKTKDGATLELLLSSALMRYAQDVRVGRVSPRQVKGERFFPSQKLDLAATVLEALAASDTKTYLESIAPQSERYKGLVQLLAELKAELVKGEWPKVSDGRKLEPGTTSARVAQLRARLAASNELGEAGNDASQVYDDKLVDAVKAYQLRSGLVGDGVVGRATLAKLNVPLADRIAQVKANMERLRWQPDDLGARYVFVNIPGYHVVAVNNGKVELDMPAIVGRPARSTPSFADQIRMVEFNPSWHVPPTIAREDVWAHLIEDPGYALEHKNVRIYQAGVEVDPYTVDWRNTDIRNYRLRAEPGPRNPLGTVKFLFPNRFDVYLHDTNERDLFAKDIRALSSGCIRIADPAAFANWLLGADIPDKWSEERRTQILDSKKQTRLILKSPVPVYLAYHTAWRDEGGRPVFRDDIYGQDALLMAALAEQEAKRRAGKPAALINTMPVAEPQASPDELQKAAP